MMPRDSLVSLVIQDTAGVHPLAGILHMEVYLRGIVFLCQVFDLKLCDMLRACDSEWMQDEFRKTRFKTIPTHQLDLFLIGDTQVVQGEVISGNVTPSTQRFDQDIELGNQ